MTFALTERFGPTIGKTALVGAAAVGTAVGLHRAYVTLGTRDGEKRGPDDDYVGTLLMAPPAFGGIFGTGGAALGAGLLLSAGHSKLGLAVAGVAAGVAVGSVVGGVHGTHISDGMYRRRFEE